MVEGDAELAAKLMPQDNESSPGSGLFSLPFPPGTKSKRDKNCPQHIPQRFEADDVARALACPATNVSKSWKRN